MHFIGPDAEFLLILHRNTQFPGVVGEEVYIYIESPARTVQTSTILVLSSIYLFNVEHRKKFSIKLQF